jgi:DnaJ homolog subfamily B member 12
MRTTFQRREPAQENNQPRSIFMQLLPIFILFGFTFLNALPSLFAPASTPDPHFSFSKSARYNVERTTGGLGIKYHVNSAEFSGHPIAAELARNTQQTPELRRYENTIERVYTQDLYAKCQRGVDRKERLINQETGIFGFGTDWGKVEKIRAEPIESCEELRKLGLLK